jgi:hypothetical protein
LLLNHREFAVLNRENGNAPGPDALFSLLRSYLQKLNIKQADQVLFVSDGAKWIWNRVPVLIKYLGLISSQVYEFRVLFDVWLTCA